MKVFLVATLLAALHCALSEASAIDTLKELIKKAEEKKQAERLLQEKRKQKDEEEALLERLVEKLMNKADKKRGLSDFFSNAWGEVSDALDGAQDRFGNAGESFLDTVGLNGNSQEDANDPDYNEDIEFPDDLDTSGNTDPCKKPVFLNENSNGVIDFPEGDGNYPNWENCRWVLNASRKEETIRIEFTAMDIRERGDCDDYVEVFALKEKPGEGHEYKGKDMTGKFCAEGLNKLPQNKRYITIDSSIAYIHFRSNIWKNAKGFSLRYQFV